MWLKGFRNCHVAQDPVLLMNATSNFGSAVTSVPGVPAAFRNGGGNQVLSQSANVVAYRCPSPPARPPCVPSRADRIVL